MSSRLREGRILGVPFVFAALLLVLSQRILPVHGAKSAQPSPATDTTTQAALITETPVETVLSADTATAPPPDMPTATPEPLVATVSAITTPIRTATPAATGVTLPPGNKLYKIMPLGDSLTEGYTLSSAGAGPHSITPWFSYRGSLQFQLREAGMQFDFVGSQNSLPPDGTDGDHEGWGGALMGPDIRLNLLTLMQPGMSNFRPDVILLLIGCNDVSYNASALTPAQTSDKLSQLVTTVTADQPQAIVLLATLPPWRDPMAADFQATYDAINARVRAVAARQGDHVYLADMNIELSADFHATPDKFFTDYVHWTELGSHRAARVWFDALALALREESARRRVYVPLLKARS